MTRKENLKKSRVPRNFAETKLKAVRMQKGMTQAQLAESTNINLRVLQHYEQGSKSFDSARLDVILKVCIALNCKMSDILENDTNIELYNAYSRI